MLPLRWFYTLVNVHLCVLKLEASTMYVSHSIVTSAILGAAVRLEARIFKYICSTPSIFFHFLNIPTRIVRLCYGIEFNTENK